VSRKIFTYFVAVMLFAVSIMPQAVFAENTADVLTLSKFKELAVKNSPDLKKQEIAIELARIAEREAKINYDNARADYQQTLGKVEAYEQAMNASKLAYEMAQYTFDDSKISLDDLKKEIEYNAERVYLKLLSLQNTIKAVEENLKIQRDFARVESIKLQLGLTTNYQYNLKKEVVMDIENQLQQLNNSHKSLIWQMNRMIGREMNSPVRLAPVTFQPVEFANKKKVLEKAREELLAISQFNRTIEDKINDTEINKSTASDIVEKLKFEIAQTQLIKDELEQTVEVAVNIAFDQLEMCKQELVDARAKYNTLQNNNINQEKLYELGLISKLEFNAGKIALQNSQNAYEEAVHNYYLAARKLQLAQEGVLVE
jgi:hypothetical protein